MNKFSFIQRFGPWELKLVIKCRRKSALPIISTQGTQPGRTSMDNALLKKVYGIIDQHLDDEMFSVDNLSREAGLSRVQLYRRVKALTGLSPNQLIRSIRIKHSAALIQQQPISISQVAYSVGFSSLSYFAVCFRKEFGIAPSQYRKYVSLG